MFGDSIKRLGRRFAERIVRVLAFTGVTPNTLTVLGFVLNIIVGAVLAFGYITLGGILLLIVSAADTLDGAMARISGKVTPFGAFLDSTLDRYSEAVIFLGLLLWYGRKDDLQMTILIYAVIVGSLMVSYTRARAEGLGLRCEVGLLARPERIVLLGIGLILQQTVFHQALLVVLWILAIFTNFTALQRIIHVWKITQTGADSNRG